MTQADIRSALRDCYHSETSLNIVDLGIIQSIDIEVDSSTPGHGIQGVPARYAVTVKLLSASSNEEVKGQIIAQIQNRLAGIAAVSRSHVDLLTVPVWTPSRISPEGRRRLGMDAHLFPILNNRAR